MLSELDYVMHLLLWPFSGGLLQQIIQELGVVLQQEAQYSNGCESNLKYRMAKACFGFL